MFSKTVALALLLTVGFVSAAPAAAPVAGLAMGRPLGTVPAIAPKLAAESINMDNPTFA